VNLEPLARLETITLDDRRRVIQVHGEIDLSNATELEQQIEQAMTGARSVAVDLRNVEFMDSQGVRLVYRLSQRLGSNGIELTFVAPASSIAGQVLKLTAVSELVPVRESLSY
jgi:anti-anti-sigma factor